MADCPRSKNPPFGSEMTRLSKRTSLLCSKKSGNPHPVMLCPTPVANEVVPVGPGSPVNRILAFVTTQVPFSMTGPRKRKFHVGACDPLTPMVKFELNGGRLIVGEVSR